MRVGVEKTECGSLRHFTLYLNQRFWNTLLKKGTQKADLYIIQMNYWFDRWAPAHGHECFVSVLFVSFLYATLNYKRQSNGTARICTRSLKRCYQILWFHRRQASLWKSSRYILVSCQLLSQSVFSRTILVSLLIFLDGCWLSKWSNCPKDFRSMYLLEIIILCSRSR